MKTFTLFNSFRSANRSAKQKCAPQTIRKNGLPNVAADFFGESFNSLSPVTLIGNKMFKTAALKELIKATRPLSVVGLKSRLFLRLLRTHDLKKTSKQLRLNYVSSTVTSATTNLVES